MRKGKKFMITMDQYAYTNRLKNVHPMEKFGMAIGTMGICLFATSWIFQLGVLIFMTFIILYIANIPVKVYVRVMLLPFLFLMIGTLGIAITVTKDSSLILCGMTIGNWMIGFTNQGLQQAGFVFFRAYASVACLYFLAFTTPMVDIVWILKKIKVPTIITELMILIYRFIFVLMETAFLIYISQECRLGYSSLKRSYHSFGKLISNLFLKAFYRSKELFLTLSARGYNGSLEVLEENYQFSKQNIVYILLIENFFLFLAMIL